MYIEFYIFLKIGYNINFQFVEEYIYYMKFVFDKNFIFIRVYEIIVLMIYLFGKFGLIKNVDIDQIIFFIFKVNSKVYCYYIYIFINIVLYCVFKYNFFKNYDNVLGSLECLKMNIKQSLKNNYCK